MNEKLKKLMEEASKDSVLAERIKSADKDEIIIIAKELNIELTEEDFKLVENQELSESELEAVTGGGDCECAVFGNGSEDGLDCGCVIGGFGDVHCRLSKCTGAGHGACVCPAAGVGATRGRECNEGTSWKYNPNVDYDY